MRNFSSIIFTSFNSANGYKYYKFFGVNRGKHDDFLGKHRVKQICSFGSFFDVNCTNCLNATQAVITV